MTIGSEAGPVTYAQVIVSFGLIFAGRNGGKVSDLPRGEVSESLCLVSAWRRGVGRRVGLVRRRSGRVAVAVAMDESSL